MDYTVLANSEVVIWEMHSIQLWMYKSETSEDKLCLNTPIFRYNFAKIITLFASKGTYLVVRHIVWSIENYYTLLNHWLLCKSAVGFPLVEHSWRTHYMTNEENHFFHFITLVGSVGLWSCMFPYQVKVGCDYDITNRNPTTKKILIVILAGSSESQITSILFKIKIGLRTQDTSFNIYGL